MDKKDDFYILNNPLLTEDGFLNEASINELKSVIMNIPKTYERLSDNEEWTVKKFTSIKDILAAFAKSAVSVSPYGLPNGLENILGYLKYCLLKSITWEQDGCLYYAKLSLCEINKCLYDILYDKGISIFDSWNSPKKDWRKEGLSESPSDPDYDFIDLDALLHNTCISIRTERREYSRLDKSCEEK